MPQLRATPKDTEIITVLFCMILCQGAHLGTEESVFVTKLLYGSDSVP